MTVHFELRHAVHPHEYKHFDTERLRAEFLIERLLTPGDVNLVYSEYERFIIGGVVPVEEILLETVDILRAEFFLARRELGVINVGGAGEVIVDGAEYPLDFKEALYIGRGSREVVFRSIHSSNPALYYFNSAPAHHAFPVKKVTKAEAAVMELGAPEQSNARTINKLLVNEVVETCQLQMGMTELKTGSVWNTMPPHVHNRRNEVYFYFEVPPDQGICHLMGAPLETRNLWMKNEQAAISPPWSIHCAAGTSNYTFIWGMAGENLDYGDMDKLGIRELK